MALEIDNQVKQYREGQMANWIADRRLYVTPDGRIVDEAEPGRKHLLAAKGRPVPDDVCRRYGLGPYADPDVPEEDLPEALDNGELDSPTEPAAETSRSHRRGRSE